MLMSDLMSLLLGVGIGLFLIILRAIISGFIEARRKDINT
jgi:hypothetical protein